MLAKRAETVTLEYVKSATECDIWGHEKKRLKRQLTNDARNAWRICQKHVFTQIIDKGINAFHDAKHVFQTIKSKCMPRDVRKFK